MLEQVGTKYDQFSAFSREEQEEITRQVRLTARPRTFRQYRDISLTYDLYSDSPAASHER